MSTIYYTKKGLLRTYLPILGLSLLMFTISIWQFFLPTTDVARYQCYALVFWQGSSAAQHLPANQCDFLGLTTAQPAFSVLPREYPPLTLLPFSFPLLVPSVYYQFAFAALMTAFMIATYGVLLRFGRAQSAQAFTFYMLLGALTVTQMRYDLLPALCALLCMLAAEHKRWTLAYLVLALGVLIKIYPLLYLPALFMAEQQSKGRLWRSWCKLPRWQYYNCLFFFLVLLGVTGIFALIDFNGAIVSQLEYFAQRPIQVETSGATLLWFARLVGNPWKIVYTFGSMNILSPLSGMLSPLITFSMLLGLIIIFWQQWRGQLTLPQTIIGLTLIFLCTGKVFSPQYLLWLIPLLAYAGFYTRFWLLIWGSISLLTTFIYAYFYVQMPPYTQLIEGLPIAMPVGFFEVSALRNMLLIGLTLAYICNWREVRTATHS